MAESGRNSIEWRKSEASASGDCVEVAFDGRLVLVRNSRDRTGPVLSFTQSEWAAFLIGARNGNFDGYLHST
jgi:Domain of unknown function (DUF397)